MRVTPLDILQKQFTANRKGYEPDEVRAFLEETRESWEETLRENQRLREEIAKRDAEIAALRETESDVAATLSLARRVADDLERGARREADVVVGEARLEAERILYAATDERRALSGDLVQLRASRARLAEELRAIVNSHAALLDALDQSFGTRS